MKRGGTTLEPVTPGDNLKIDGTTALRGVTYTWPSADATAANQALVSDGSGQLSWVSVATGTSAVNSIQGINSVQAKQSSSTDWVNTVQSGDVQLRVQTGDGINESSNRLITRIGDGLQFDPSGTANERNIEVQNDGNTLVVASTGVKVNLAVVCEEIPSTKANGDYIRRKADSGETWETVNLQGITKILEGNSITVSDPTGPEVTVGVKTLTTNSGLINGASGLGVGAGTGLTANANAVNIDSVNLWGNSHDHSASVDGSIVLGSGNHVQWTNNSQSVQFKLAADQANSYNLLPPKNNTVAASNILEVDSISGDDIQLKWVAKPSGGGSGGVTNEVQGGPGITVTGGTTDTAKVSSDHNTNRGLTLTGTGDAQQLAINNAGTGTTIDSNGVSVTSRQLWGNAHDHSADINGTILLGTNNNIVFTDGTNTTTIKDNDTLTGNVVVSLPNASGTLVTTTSGNTPWKEVANVVSLQTPTNTVQARTLTTDGNENMSVSPGGTGDLTIGSLTAGSTTLLRGASTSISGTNGITLQ